MICRVTHYTGNKLWLSKESLGGDDDFSNLDSKLITESMRAFSVINMNDQVLSVWAETGNWKLYKNFDYNALHATICEGQQVRFNPNAGLSSATPAEEESQCEGNWMMEL